MDLKQLATGVLSGYVFKGLQLAISLLIVPFLLDPSVLGVEDYGRMFAMFGLTGAVGIAVVGFHASAERAIARAIGGVHSPPTRTVADLLGSGTKILTVVSLAFVIPLMAFDTIVLKGIGIPVEARYRDALLAACAIAVFENSFHLFRAPLIARGDISFVNLVGMLELLGRTTVVIAAFVRIEATVATYLTIQAVFTLVRQLAFAARLPRADVEGFLRTPISNGIETLRYAGPISLAEGSAIVVRSIPAMLASRFLGAAEAGYVAVVVNTLQGYLLQAFTSVVQPLALPIASRFRIAATSQSRRQRLLEIESTYSLGIAVVFSQIIFWTPSLIPLWLGEEFDLIILPAQIMIAGCGFQTCNLIRRAMLIGQGALPDAVPVIFGAALAAASMMITGILIFHSWTTAIVASAGFLLASSGPGVDRTFTRMFDSFFGTIRLTRSTSLGLIFLSGWLFSRQTSNTHLLVNLTWGVVSMSVAMGIAFLTILSLKRVSILLAQLYRARSTNIYE